jgi:hypothetical protein
MVLECWLGPERAGIAGWGFCCYLEMQQFGAGWSFSSSASQASRQHAVTPDSPRRAAARACRTFYRVWAFFILEFQVMAVLLWGWGNWYALSSVCLTHAALSLLEQVAGAWTQRAPGGWVGGWVAKERGG